jgi:hypothetical protein
MLLYITTLYTGAQLASGGSGRRVIAGSEKVKVRRVLPKTEISRRKGD